MYTCPICKKKYGLITGSHLKTHGMTVTEFREQYPECQDALPKCRPFNKRRHLSEAEEYQINVRNNNINKILRHVY